MMSMYDKCMIKDFSAWSEKCSKIEGKIANIYFREGEIWWTSLGLNIGYEIDGKGDDFARPVLVLKKHNQFTFIGLPLSTINKSSRYLVPIGSINGKEAVANLSQIRNLDSKRLIKRIGAVESQMLEMLLKKTGETILNQSFHNLPR